MSEDEYDLQLAKSNAEVQRLREIVAKQSAALRNAVRWAALEQLQSPAIAGHLARVLEETCPPPK